MTRPAACSGMPRAAVIAGMLLAVGCTERVRLPGSPSLPDLLDSGSEAPPDAGTDRRPPADADGCWEWQFRSLPVSRDIPKLIIALDVSVGNVSGGSLLQSVQKALADLLPAYDGAIQFGYEPFPARTCTGGTCCAAMDLRVKPISRTAGAIQRELACDVSGFCRVESEQSPSFDALRACRKYYEAEASSASRFVLLLSDRDPVCDGEQSGCEEAGDETSRMAVLGIKTIVIGLGEGSDHTDCLARIANKGRWSTTKKPPFASDTDTLKPLLKTVFDDVSAHQCQLALKSEPANKAQVVVTFDDDFVPRDPKRTNGWEFDSGSDTRIDVYGFYCSLLTGSMVASVKAGLVCCAGSDSCR